MTKAAIPFENGWRAVVIVEKSTSEARIYLYLLRRVASDASKADDFLLSIFGDCAREFHGCSAPVTDRPEAIQTYFPVLAMRSKTSFARLFP